MFFAIFDYTLLAKLTAAKHFFTTICCSLGCKRLRTGIFLNYPLLAYVAIRLDAAAKAGAGRC